MSSDTAPAFGLIVIGDEILSGRRADKHLPKWVELLGERGLRLAWAEYVGDEPERITAVLRRAFASGDVVVSCGGIGATPDDHTRQCAAAALGRPLLLHPEAKALIEARTRDVAAEQGRPYEPDRPDNLHRLNMGVFPEGAQIIPNPYNRIPGFYCSAAREGANHPPPGGPKAGPAPSGGSDPHVGERGGVIYFLPGFPVMAWPMMAWVLDSHYSAWFQRDSWRERSVIVFGGLEATLTPVMERVEAAHPGVKVFSLPSVDHPEYGRHIDLGVKGRPDAVEPAYADLRTWLAPFELRYGPELVRP
ncbi:MAG: competence/damage-inducible protein A [Proteobacteria bacterium]|nr:competence/damage-inducible protein A [Pseudomonadota bacterium]